MSKLEKLLKSLRYKPGSAVWEARMLPLCYAEHLKGNNCLAVKS